MLQHHSLLCRGEKHNAQFYSLTVKLEHHMIIQKVIRFYKIVLLCYNTLKPCPSQSPENGGYFCTPYHIRNMTLRSNTSTNWQLLQNYFWPRPLRDAVILNTVFLSGIKWFPILLTSDFFTLRFCSITCTFLAAFCYYGLRKRSARRLKNYEKLRKARFSVVTSIFITRAQERKI